MRRWSVDCWQWIRVKLLSNNRPRRGRVRARDWGASRVAEVQTLESRVLLSASASQPFAVTDLQAFQGGNQGAAPLSTAGPNGYTPAQIKAAYGFNNISFSGTPADGRNTTIAIVDAYNDPNIAGDLHQFDVAFGLPDTTLTVENQNGSTSNLPAADAGWITEIALDVEWAHAIAPGANILLVEANSSSFGDLLTAVDTARNTSGVVAVSMSWGGGEFSGETNYDPHFTTPAGHAGVTFVASSGDSGAPASYPATSPNVLTVGGTSLYLNPDNSYRSESGWNGSGGGISAYESQPAYQNGNVTGSSTKRVNPDVAYDADPGTGFPVYDSYNNGTAAPWGQWGGTSDAAPQWAGLIAIADQGRIANGSGSLDGRTQTLPAVYAMPQSDFHDVTSGTSTGTPNYSAGTGFDLVTGRGSPIANLVVSDLGAGNSQVTLTAPQNVTAAALSSTSAQLNWTPASGEQGYRVYQVTSGTGSGTGPVAVQDSSFETPALTTPGAWTSTAPTGWTLTGQGGVFLPRSGTQVTTVPDGKQVAWLYHGSLFQDLGVAVDPNATYQLNLSVGTELDYSAASDNYQISLVAGGASGTVIAQTSGTLQAKSGFVPISISGTGAGSGDLGILITTSTGQPLFDNIQVQASGSSSQQSTLLATLGASATSYQVNGLTPGSTASFMVEAFNGSVVADSNVASVTLPTSTSATNYAVVQDPSFETPALTTAGSWTSTAPTGWTLTGQGGVFLPKSGSQVASVPDGKQVAWLYNGSLFQDLGIAVDPNKTYQLSLSVGTEFDYPAASDSYQIALVAGGASGTVIAQTSGTLQAKSGFVPVTISGKGLGSGNLGILITATGGQPLFDNVQVQIS